MRRKLKKTEDLFQASRKNATEANKQATRSRDGRMKEAANFTVVKGTLTKELEELRRSSNEKSRASAAKIAALEADLT